MASSKQGFSYLEAVFRHHFKIDKSVDIMKLMEASITVVAFKHPRKFEKRRKAILGDCFGEKAIQDDHEDDDTDDEEEGEADYAVPEEFQKNRDTRTDKVVVEEATAKNPKAMINVNDEEEGEDDHTVPEEVQKKRDTSTNKVVVEEPAAKNPKAMIDVSDEKMMQSKLERSKRNLHQMYEDIRKKKRKIQVLDLDDAPKVAPDVSSCKRFAGSRFKR